MNIGPSLAKIPLDIARAHDDPTRVSGRYDAVHSHEEGSFIGIVVAAVLGVPHLNHMHSSLPQQLTNFVFSRSRSSRAFPVARALCAPALAGRGGHVSPSRGDRAGLDIVRTVLIENSPGSGIGPGAPG